jgi:epoxyqueuosine reductase
LGNAPSSEEVLTALHARREDASAMVREHVEWALQRHAEHARAATDRLGAEAATIS